LWPSVEVLSCERDVSLRGNRAGGTDRNHMVLF
jgi:hypothetical protein